MVEDQGSRIEVRGARLVLNLRSSILDPVPSRDLTLGNNRSLIANRFTAAD
jgi:hypothetical protein